MVEKNQKKNDSLCMWKSDEIQISLSIDKV